MKFESSRQANYFLMFSNGGCKSYRMSTDLHLMVFNLIEMIHPKIKIVGVGDISWCLKLFLELSNKMVLLRSH